MEIAQRSFKVSKSVEEVWEEWSDPNTWSLYLPGVVGIEDQGGGTFEWKSDEEFGSQVWWTQVSELRPKERVEVSSTSPSMMMSVSVESVDAGTELRLSMMLSPEFLPENRSMPLTEILEQAGSTYLRSQS